MEPPYNQPEGKLAVVKTVFDISYEAPSIPGVPGAKQGRVTLECTTVKEALWILSNEGGCIDEWEPPYEAIPFGAIRTVKLAK